VYRNSTDVQGTRVVRECWVAVVTKGYRRSTGVQWVQGYRFSSVMQVYNSSRVIQLVQV